MTCLSAARLIRFRVEERRVEESPVLVIGENMKSRLDGARKTVIDVRKSLRKIEFTHSLSGSESRSSCSRNPIGENTEPVKPTHNQGRSSNT